MLCAKNIFIKLIWSQTIVDICHFAYICGPCRARGWDIFNYWGQFVSSIFAWNWLGSQTWWICAIATFTHRRHLPIASIRYDAWSIRYLIVVAYGYLSRENWDLIGAMGKCRLLQRNSRPWTTVRGNCQSYEKTVRSYSCPHWVQLLFISGSSSPGAVFFSYWIWARGQRLVEWG